MSTPSVGVSAWAIDYRLGRPMSGSCQSNNMRLKHLRAASYCLLPVETSQDITSNLL